jgi:hypothetical protein
MRLTPIDFWAKWEPRLADNDTFDITAGDVRAFAQDVKDSFANLSTLTVKQVKGAPYPVPFTDTLFQIPPDYRILGMEAVARFGVDSASGGAGVTADPVYFHLLKYSAGDIDALLDLDTVYHAQSPTTDTVKARWVQVSGTDEEKIASFPVLQLEDFDYQAGDVVQYTFPGGQTRLVQWKADSTGYMHPLPTGLDTDPIYRNFAPLNGTGAGGSGASNFAQLAGDPRDNDALAGQLDYKADLFSPALLGVPTAPTAPLGTNTTQVATMAALKAAINALLNAAPGALDTLNELAAALGNDPNFATTMAGALALRATTAQLEAVRTQVGLSPAKAGSYTLALADAGNVVPFTVAATCTIPANATVPFPVGTIIEPLQASTTGVVTIAAGAGVSLVLGSGGTKTAGLDGSSVRLLQRALNVWVISGGYV